MRRGPDPRIGDERELDAPSVPIYVWNEIDRVKAENRGWFIVKEPTIKDLKRLCSEGVFAALEADECPVRFTYESDGRMLNFPLGVSEKKIKQLIWATEDEIRKQK